MMSDVPSVVSYGANGFSNKCVDKVQRDLSWYVNCFACKAAVSEIDLAGELIQFRAKAKVTPAESLKIQQLIVRAFARAGTQMIQVAESESESEKPEKGRIREAIECAEYLYGRAIEEKARVAEAAGQVDLEHAPSLAAEVEDLCESLRRVKSKWQEALESAHSSPRSTSDPSSEGSGEASLSSESATPSAASGTSEAIASSGSSSEASLNSTWSETTGKESTGTSLSSRSATVSAASKSATGARAGNPLLRLAILTACFVALVASVVAARNVALTR